MALAKRATAGFSLSDLIAEASDFARDAWRDCWLAMLVVAGAQALIFLNQHVAASEWRPGPLSWIAPLLLVFYVPLYGGLYRAALGGPAFKTLGPGGLQWSGSEWRLIAVGIVIAFIVGLAMTPFLAVIGIAAVIMGLHAVMSAGPLGQWARWAPAAALIWLIFFWIMAPRIARLMLGWAYSIVRQKVEPFAGWAPAKGVGWKIAFGLVISYVPVMLGWLAVYALTLIEPDALVAGYWPLPEAIGAAVLLGGLTAAVQAPLSAGILSGAYWLLEGGYAADADTADLHHDHAPTDAAMAAGAAAIAAQEAAELGLAPSEVDHGLSDEAPADGEAHQTVEGDHPAEPGEAVAGEGEVESHDPPPIHEEHTVDPALAGIHPTEAEASTGAMEDEAAAAAQHAEPEAAPHVAVPEAAVHAPEPEVAIPEAAAHAPEPIHPEPEILHPEPEPLHLEPEVHAEPPPVEVAPDVHVEAPPGGALSPWPHSVLPPWPTGVSGPRAYVPPPARPTSTLPGAAMPLAPDREPGHPSEAIAEQG